MELFTYYLILNAVVVSIAWFRAWRLLNWVGFVCTFGIGLLWGAEYYRPEFFSGSEPFLLAHVGLYILVAVLFASRQPPRLRGLVDGTIVFGTPLVGFGMQAALLADSAYGLAWSALGLGVLYLLLAAGLWRHDRRHYRLLFECFLALGVGRGGCLAGQVHALDRGRRVGGLPSPLPAAGAGAGRESVSRPGDFLAASCRAVWLE